MDIPYVDFVCSDNKMAASLVAEQFIRCGCKSIGWLNYKESTWSGINRGEMFYQVMVEKGVCDENDLVQITAEMDGYEGGRQAAHRFCAQGKKVDGVFCANAQLACGFLDGMRRKWLRCAC